MEQNFGLFTIQKFAPFLLEVRTLTLASSDSKVKYNFFSAEIDRNRNLLNMRTTHFEWHETVWKTKDSPKQRMAPAKKKENTNFSCKEEVHY
jgi:hypothetical protein